MHVLEARGLTKVFGEGDARVEALRGVELSVSESQLVAIMGPSGSGKSTLLSLLGGVDLPTAGQVLLEGKDLANLSDDQRTLIRRKRIGFIFQSFNLLPILTALENVALPLELDGVGAAEAQRRAIEALELVGMVGRRTHIPGTLSGGEQQRVAVARALVIQPAILLADEPTGNLDSVNGQKLTTLLRTLVNQRRQTIVMVTHDPDVAAHADRIIHIRDGVVFREVQLTTNGAAGSPPGTVLSAPTDSAIGRTTENARSERSPVHDVLLGNVLPGGVPAGGRADEKNPPGSGPPGGASSAGSPASAKPADHGNPASSANSDGASKGKRSGRRRRKRQR
jgi:putative ABC transport system ATP-binding protein